MRVKSFIGTHQQDWADPGFKSHESVEITTVLEGRGRFMTKGQQHDVESGHVVLIPSHFPHLFSAVTPIRFGVILAAPLSSGAMEIFQRLVSQHAPKIITLSRLNKDQYELLLRQWLRIFSSSLKEKERNYGAWIEVMLLFLLEHSHRDDQALTVIKSADYIRENLRDSFHMSDLADLAGLTEESFRRRFMRIYKMTPKQYQQQCRMTEAKWFLSSSDKDVQEIAELVGFSRLHSFSLWFKKIEGLPPTTWRKSLQKDFE